MISPSSEGGIDDVDILGSSDNNGVYDVNIALPLIEEQKYYSITSKAGEGGIITPEGMTRILSGGSQSYMIIPNTGYIISDVIVDGASIGAVSDYTFKNITSDHALEVIFDKKDESKSNQVEKIILSHTFGTLKEGNTLQLTAIVSPSNASDKSLKWSSNDTSIAQVSTSGLVTAISVGEAVITVEACDGSDVKAYFKLTVNNSETETVDEIYSDKNSQIVAIKSAQTKISSLIAGSKKIDVKYAKLSIDGICYQVGIKKNGTSSWIKKSTVDTSMTISGLQNNAIYSVSVRPYKQIGSSIYYGKWSTSKSIRVTSGSTNGNEISKVNKSKTSITKLTAGKKKLTIKLKKVTISGIKYQINIKKKGTSTWKKYYSSTSSKIIKGLNSKKVYYVSVRPYKKIGGKTYFGYWSETKKVKIK